MCSTIEPEILLKGDAKLVANHFCKLPLPPSLLNLLHGMGFELLGGQRRIPAISSIH